MRCIIFSSTALIVVGAVAATPSFAAAKREAMHVANLSVTDSFNACVGLAKQRGFRLDGLEGSAPNNSARPFVIRCMQGKQR